MLTRAIKRSLAALTVLALFASVLISTASPADAQTPICASADSDSDGDGWGWENNQSCRVAEQPAPVTQAPPTSEPTSTFSSPLSTQKNAGVVTLHSLLSLIHI